MLVEAWANSGAAWVELTEQLNPTMVFKMSEIDPEVIEVRRRNPQPPHTHFSGSGMTQHITMAPPMRQHHTAAC